MAVKPQKMEISGRNSLTTCRTV